MNPSEFITFKTSNKSSQQPKQTAAYSQHQKKSNNQTRNIKQMVTEILQQINCCNNCQFPQILHIFADKICQLRQAQSAEREKYLKHVSGLQYKLNQLSLQNSKLRKLLKANHQQNSSSKTKQIKQLLKNEQIQQLQSYQEIANQSFDSLIRQTNKFQMQNKCINKSKQKTTKFNKIQNIFERQCEQLPNTQSEDLQSIKKIVFKYNINNQELQKMLEQYFLIEPSGIYNIKLQQLKDVLVKQRKRTQTKQVLGYKKLQLAQYKQNIC